jgi:hypothetical protein
VGWPVEPVSPVIRKNNKIRYYSFFNRLNGPTGNGLNQIMVKNNTPKVKIKWRIANNNTSMLENRAKPHFSGP